MTLTVNGEPHPWREGLTVAALLEEKTFSFPLKIVLVNKRLVKKGEQSATLLEDGDVVEVVHLIGGG
ncbi:MAG: sulfur carrier protein ThiS [Acidobacteriia bacterium]|nr:sulfur carrier protein ThiS [Terriglobia bacterium]